MLTGWFGLSLALGREMILGGVLGFAMSLFLLPAHVAGEFITQEAGLSFANTVTATGGSSSSPLAGLFEMAAALIFFALDLHHVFLLVLQETFHMTPIGQELHLPNWDLVMATGAAEEAGLLLAGPVALCLFLTTVVIILMARVAPQLNLYSFGLPLRVLVCLLVLPLLLPQIVTGHGRAFCELHRPAATTKVIHGGHAGLIIENRSPFAAPARTGRGGRAVCVQPGSELRRWC